MNRDRELNERLKDIRRINRKYIVAGSELLEKPNKTEEEKIAVESYKKTISFITVSVIALLVPVVVLTSIIMISIVTENNDIISVEMMYLFLAMILIVPILMVAVAFIPRASFGIPWREYYHKYYDSNGIRKENVDEHINDRSV